MATRETDPYVGLSPEQRQHIKAVHYNKYANGEGRVLLDQGAVQLHHDPDAYRVIAGAGNISKDSEDAVGEVVVDVPGLRTAKQLEKIAESGRSIVGKQLTEVFNAGKHVAMTFENGRVRAYVADHKRTIFTAAAVGIVGAAAAAAAFYFPKRFNKEPEE